jgi:hypothetical protein
LWYNSIFSNIPTVITWKRKSRGNLKFGKNRGGYLCLQ